MIITKDYSQILLKKSIVTIGFFDGVHLGHRRILQTAVAKAKKLLKKSIVITLWPHPRIVLNQDVETLRFLTTLEEKQNLIAENGIDILLILDFTPKLASQPAREFVQDLLINKLNVSSIVIGYNHVFGHRGQGDFQLLKEMESAGNFKTFQVDPIKFDGINISSTKIRAALEQGNLAFANHMLGRPYEISGTIEGGKQIGRSIGYPTANISPVEPLKQIPGDGVYAVWVDYNGISYPSMLNIGKKPTLNDNSNRTIEAHIIGFNQNIYNEQITVRFIDKIREEEKFPSLDHLKKQLAKDKVKVQELLGYK
jgi:riboflavin kinase/FMN adenylyltransferase